VSTPLVECLHVSKRYAVARGGQRYEVKALDDVSVSIAAGRTVGLVGESGSGKSTLGQIAAALTAPSSGEVRIAGASAAAGGTRRQRELRRRLQVVWQDPLSSMNVRDTIETIITEAPIVHGLIDRSRRRARAEEIVASVGLPTDVVVKRPTQLSGGQLQRIAIGRALALEPELLVCDEVTSALDVSMQAQILNLLHDVQKRTNVAYLFISHDLHVVKHISDTVAVMYAGRVVETGPAATVYADPQHPYTRELVRVAHAELMARSTANDQEPGEAYAAEGCSYRATCPLRQPICETVRPELAAAPSGALAACHVVAPRAIAA
jgi:oligopeptide/dipeptide ABC transporter ATP-binding protein